MTLSLLLFSLLALLAVAGLVVDGFLVRAGTTSVTLHVYLAAPIIVFAMLVHTMTIFYFIGTGKEIRELSRERSLDARYVREARGFKKHVFPAATGVLLLLIATFVVGGGVHVGAIPWPVHLVLAFLTLAVSALAFIFEVRCIYENVLLAERFTEALAGAGAGPVPGPEEAPPPAATSARAVAGRGLPPEGP